MNSFDDYLDVRDYLCMTRMILILAIYSKIYLGRK